MKRATAGDRNHPHRAGKAILRGSPISDQMCLYAVVVRGAAMRRREIVAGLGSVVFAPGMSSAQQVGVPIIGAAFSSDIGSIGPKRNLAGYRRGLAELGYVEGRDYRFESKYANYQYDKIQGILRELLAMQIAMLVVPNTALITAAKQIVRSVPIVFTMGSDPVENGIVESLNKPGGNITGIFTPNTLVDGKRVHLLHELLPSARTFAFITNPDSPKFSGPQTREVRTAAQSIGIDLIVLNARNPAEFEPAFEAAKREGVNGVILGTEAIFVLNQSKLQMLAAQHRLPTIYGDYQPVREGGLISYGGDQDDAYRWVGLYAGRVLKGENPTNMPVQQATKTVFAINLKAAKDLGITVPPMLLSRADEVIE